MPEIDCQQLQVAVRADAAFARPAAYEALETRDVGYIRIPPTRILSCPPRNFRGTYSIRNQRLTFSFSDGKQATVAFIAPKALEKASAFEWFGLAHGSGVPGAETVIVLMLYEKHYQVRP